MSQSECQGAASFAFLVGGFANKKVRPAAGIFVNDILDAVPIDKYFELFKPGAGGEGGYIRISINFVKDLKDLDKSTGARPQRVMSTCRAQRNGDAGKSHDGAAFAHGL